MAAEGGPARDDRTVRSIFFNLLVDWKKIYEPLTDQIGYLFTAFLFIVGIGIAVGLYKKWNKKRKDLTIPYKVIQPPEYLVNETDIKPVVAVIGATGFFGSHIAEAFISSGKYRVYLLGRRFKPSKILPNADAVFQVDMMDVDGLTNALQSVDTVINSAAAIPTVYSSDDDLWYRNVAGVENIIAACRNAGVKNLVQIGGVSATNITNSTWKTFMNAFATIEKYLMETKDINTCVVQFGQIYGVRSSLWDEIIAGKITHSPMLESRGTFIPVEYAATAIVRAQERMAQGDEKVIRKIIKVAGYESSLKEFLSLEEWGRKIGHSPKWFVLLMAWCNVVTGRTFGWTPLGPEMCPAICSLFDLLEEEFDASLARETLGLDEVPSIREGVAKMVARYYKDNSASS